MRDAVTLRRAGPRDRSLVLFFHRELYVRYRDEIMEKGLEPLYAYRDLDAALRDDVDALLHGNRCIVLVAERDGEPLGYITGHVENDERRLLPKKGVVEDWLVVDEARGLGVGKLLMDGLVDVFRGQGCHVVESGTWAFNTHARKAHAAAGFHEIEVRFRKALDD